MWCEEGICGVVEGDVWCGGRGCLVGNLLIASCVLEEGQVGRV